MTIGVLGQCTHKNLHSAILVLCDYCTQYISSNYVDNSYVY